MATNARINKTLAAFGRSEHGNIAVLFAIAAVPILSFVGAAIDYTRANSARSSMQAALDSTSLMLAKDLQDGKITAADIATKASAYFTALYTNTDARSVTVSATYTASTPQGSTIVVNGSGNVPTEFMKIARMAEAFHCRVIPHASIGIGIFQAASLHAAAALQHVPYHEYQHSVFDRNLRFVTGDMRCERGRFHLPDGTGHGVAPSDDVWQYVVKQ